MIGPSTRGALTRSGYHSTSPAAPPRSAARPEIFSHKVETVPRLYRAARTGSRYRRTLDLLADAAGRRDAGSRGGVVRLS